MGRPRGESHAGASAVRVPPRVERRARHRAARAARAGDRLVAGGHSLIPMMKLRLAAPELLVDINELTDLAFTVEGDVAADRGAHPPRDAAGVTGGRGAWPGAARRRAGIADAIVRNRGTVGGSVCQADPSEDLSGAFCALRAEAVIRGERGPARCRCGSSSSGRTRRRCGPAEMLVELRVPLWATGSAYVKVDRRAGDWAVAAAAAALRVADGVITDAGLGLTAVGAVRRRGGRGEPAWGGRRRRRRSPRRGGSPRSTAVRAPTSAGPSTTSATWRAS